MAMMTCRQVPNGLWPLYRQKQILDMYIDRDYLTSSLLTYSLS